MMHNNVYERVIARYNDPFSFLRDMVSMIDDNIDIKMTSKKITLKHKDTKSTLYSIFINPYEGLTLKDDFITHLDKEEDEHLHMILKAFINNTTSSEIYESLRADEILFDV